MSRLKKDPLRELTAAERQELTQLNRSQAAPAAEVAGAKALLAVADGDDCQQAARAAGRRSCDAVSHLVARFNAEGPAALTPRHGGGRRSTYDASARERILREVRRTPTPEAGGAASWSLSTLRKALRSAPDGLPAVSTSTIGKVLHEAGYSHRRTRAWCPSGSALRLRKAGPVVVSDPDAEPKKS
jgi:transposase